MSLSAVAQSGTSGAASPNSNVMMGHPQQQQPQGMMGRPTQPPAQSVPGLLPPFQHIHKNSRCTTVTKPIGIDPFLLLSERENKYVDLLLIFAANLCCNNFFLFRVTSKIQTRMAELELDVMCSNGSLPLKNQIELRALRLLNFQRKLRQDVRHYIFIRAFE